MKRKIVVIMGLIILTSLGLIFILNSKNKPYEITNDNNGQFAFFYEDENGDYQRSTESKWDSGNYILNLENTTCDGVNNPNFLSWNNDNNSVTLTRNKATKCSLYFDIKTFDMDCDEDLLSCFIAKKQGTQVGDKEGEELLYHNNTIDVNNDGSPDDAGDLSYRYSGDNPDNFVCFGTDQSPCPVENLYRILGVFPFAKEDGTTEYRVKLIKSEYITQEELGIGRYDQFNLDYNSTVGMGGIEPRVQKTQNIDQFKWVYTNSNNNWNNSQIKIALNNYYYNGFNSKWQKMIATTNWFIGGVGNYVDTSIKNFYIHELGSERLKSGDVSCIEGNNTQLTECHQNLLELKAKIGLIYASDYLYTSAKSNWNLFPGSSENGFILSLNREANWMYNGFYEYTISRNSENIDAIYHIDGWGYLYSWSESQHPSATVRPTFYLDADTLYLSGEGTSSNPFIISDGTYDYNYKPEAQEFSAPVEGDYLVELWGAQGSDFDGYVGGKGAYTKGIIHLKQNDNLYIYTGEQGFYGDMDRTPFNGGGKVIWSLYGGTGGGATDIRLEKTSWNDFNGLKTRIMVAAGGGGANNRNGDNPEIYYGRGNGGAGGALTGLNGEYDLVSSTNPNDGNIWGYFYGSGGTQVKAGTGIIGDNNSDAIANDFSLYKPEGHFGYADSSQSGGGGGYYSGGGGEHAGAGGGSSFISGYKGCVAIEDTSSERNIISKCTEENAKNNVACSYHYSGKIFTGTLMKAGNESIPSPTGGNEIGHSGNGYAKITLINTSTENEWLTKAVDLSGNDYNGKFINGVKIQKDEEGNQGLYFDGNQSYIDVGTLPDTINWADGFSYEFEAKWYAFNYFSRIVDFANGPESDNIIFCVKYSNNETYPSVFYESMRREYADDAFTNLSLNQRIKIKVTYAKTDTGFKETLYKDGIVIRERDYNVENLVRNITRNNNYIGKSNYSQDLYFNGYIYNIKFTDSNGKPILWYDFSR